MTEPDLVVTVAGTPAPQGSKNAYQRGSRIVLVESSRKVKPWRAVVAAAARVAHGDREPLDGPLEASMVFTFARPPSARRRPYPSVSPDLSKLLRATEDALDVDAGVITNDARIVSYRRLGKFYVDTPAPDVLPYPGAVIRLWRGVSAGQ